MSTRRTPSFVLAAMTIAVHSPFFARRYDRPAYITPKQYRLIAKVMTGWRGDQRALAESVGYTIGGLNDALQSLRALGILAVSTTRGRYGGTRLQLKAGVHLDNVRVQDRRSQSVLLESDEPRTRTMSLAALIEQLPALPPSANLRDSGEGAPTGE
jgi:hypothetical protein